ncbi:MAG: hypothetical protein K2X47_16670 [Bdellovibrionales bacterium]|nr:hypothetical protein [Bdellovibrionales bacterium]
MSEDSSQVRLHLLIVATNPKGLQTAQRYLERRDVICSVVKTVKEAVGYVTKHKPAFVMLSWNLEGVNPVKIMQVISQSFNVKVILFAERGDTSTSIQLNSCGAPFTLQMPINGPKILIKLQNIVREEQELKDNPDRDKEKVRHGGTAGTGAADKGAIHLSGSAKGNDTIVMRGSAAAKDGTFNGSASISSSGTRAGSGAGYDDGGAVLSSNPNQTSDGTFMGNTGGTAGIGPQGYVGEAEAAKARGRALGGQGFRSEDPNFNGTGEASSRRNDAPGSVDHRPGHIPKANQQPARQGRSGSLNGLDQGAQDKSEPGVSPNLGKADTDRSSQTNGPSGAGAKEKKNRTFEGVGEKHQSKTPGKDEPGVSGQLAELGSAAEKKRGQNGSRSDEEEESGSHWDPASPEPGGPESPLSSERKAALKREAVILPPKETVLKGSRSESVLADSVKVVVKQVSQRTTEEARSLQATRQISVLTVNSPRFRGYLVAAHGPNKKVDEDFTKALKLRLMEHLRKQGEKMQDGEADFDMEIQKVEFGAWAEEFADFVALSHHDDSEIAVAFVGGEDSLAEFSESVSADMMSCQLQNFVVGEPVQCDMFLHLQKNDKYVRYLKQGAPLTQEQKDRLMKKEVKDLHFNKSDLMKYKEYVGKSFIRNKLGESKVFVKKGSGTDKAA